MRKKVLIPALSGATALAIVGTVAGVVALRTIDVTLSVDGQPRTIQTQADTVGELLEAQGLTVGQHDVVLPAKDTELSDGTTISLNYGRPFTVTVDGKERVVWTTARTVDEALGFLNLDAADSKVSASRSAAISRNGLSVDVVTAKNVTLIAEGKKQDIHLAGTVKDVLAKAGLSKDSDDIVEPSLDEALTDGMQIRFVDVEQKESTREVKIPFSKTSKTSDDLASGEEKITQEGVDGVRREVYVETLHDGVKVKSEKKSEQVVKQAVEQVTTVGTKGAAQGSSTDSQALTPAVGNTCKASYYWEPQPTANGEQFNPNAMTAAHKSLPFNTRVKVTNKSNGKSTIVRINDRGPYVSGRCLDLSKAAMKAIGGTSAGVVTVTWETVG